MLAGADDGEIVCVFIRQTRRRHAGNPASAHLAEREGFDDCLQLAGIAVPQGHQRRGAACGVRPGLGTDNIGAFDHRTDGVQRVMAAPDLVRLGHVARGAGCFQRKARLQRRNGFRQA